MGEIQYINCHFRFFTGDFHKVFFVSQRLKKTPPYTEIREIEICFRVVAYVNWFSKIMSLTEIIHIITKKDFLILLHKSVTMIFYASKPNGLVCS